MGVRIRQKNKGKGQPWWVFIHHKGKRKSIKVGDQKAAKRLAAKIEFKLKVGELGIDQKPVPTFGELAQEWITTVVPATCKESTQHDYEIILKKHLGKFSARPIDQITRRDVKTHLLAKLKRGKSASTVTHIKNVMSGVFSLALDGEFIDTNPAKQLGRLITEKPRGKDVKPLSHQDLEALLKTFAEHRPREFPLVMTLARAGLRAGEALGLMWSDLDFEARTIHIQRSLSRMNLVTPKSGKARTVDMSTQLSGVLKDHRLAQKKEAMAKGWGQAPEMVFVNQEGRPVDINPWRRHYWKPMLRKAKLEGFRIHDLRHTFATHLIMGGANIVYVSRLLGHHSVKLTLDIYTHWLPSESTREVDTLDSMDTPNRTLYAPNNKKGAGKNA